jgi:hypothetical protein
MPGIKADHPSSSSDARIELLSPDGYYKYLGIEKQSDAQLSAAVGSDETTDPLNNGSNNNNNTIIDEDAIRKNYRKLSLKHHPDRPGGDADLFRHLNRAQKVLLDPKLRRQYDILGIDLDDEEAEHGEEDKEASSSSQHQGIIQEIASMALAALIHAIVRTVVMAVVACLVVRYRLLLYPACLLLLFIAFRVYRHSKIAGVDMHDILPPLVILAGLLLMHYGDYSDKRGLTLVFWLGETLTIGSFIYNSVPTLPRNKYVMIAIGVVSMLAALWFRGRVWNYALVIGFEVFMAIFLALAFPILEYILESILNDKLRKVGDKVRAHHKILEMHYETKMEKARGGKK